MSLKAPPKWCLPLSELHTLYRQSFLQSHARLEHMSAPEDPGFDKRLVDRFQSLTIFVLLLRTFGWCARSCQHQKTNHSRSGGRSLEAAQPISFAILSGKMKGHSRHSQEFRGGSTRHGAQMSSDSCLCWLLGNADENQGLAPCAPEWELMACEARLS